MTRASSIFSSLYSRSRGATPVALSTSVFALIYEYVTSEDPFVFRGWLYLYHSIALSVLPNCDFGFIFNLLWLSNSHVELHVCITVVYKILCYLSVLLTVDVDLRI